MIHEEVYGEKKVLVLKSKNEPPYTLHNIIYNIMLYSKFQNFQKY